MLIGAGLDRQLGLPLGELRGVAREAERLGFESLWTPYVAVPDAFHVCALWSEDTSLRTGISVVPVGRSWTPLALAVQAATVSQLSSGRFVLGLGTGGYGPTFWASVGLPNKPITVIRDYANVVHRLLAGEKVSHPDPAMRLANTSIAVDDVPPVPVYVAALGPQMLGLAGEVADGALLNWATPERIATSRELIASSATAAGRDPADVKVAMYIRVCIDDDVDAARLAFGSEVLRYSMGRAGISSNFGYRGLFAQMGFDDALSELEKRRDAGAPLSELVAGAPDEMLQAVGYYGPAAGAPAAFARLRVGLDEAMVRVITARPGAGPVVEALEALTPALIRAAS